MNSKSKLGILLVLGIPGYALGFDMQQCLLEQLEDAQPNMTVGQLKKRCEVLGKQGLVSSKSAQSSHPQQVVADAEQTPYEHRREVEEATQNELFVITPHKPNYVLPISYNNNPNGKPFKADDESLSHTEVKFQLSLKVPVWQGIFAGRGDLYLAYTNQSWWQAYNKDNSSPFRETNHEPEAFLQFDTSYELLGMNLRAVQLGISHQSNGRGGDLSRSWNRVYTNFLFERDNFVMTLKPWWRIPEPEKDYPGQASGDDNPDIEKYMGYGEAHFVYKINDHNVGMMLRNNLRKDNKGAVQLDWSFPINQRLRGYVQYFNGYGESLIDYNASVSRLSVGVMLTDWL